MSVNNINSGFLPFPQIAQSSTGQLFMIATHQQQLAYLFPRPYPGSPQMPQAVQSITGGIFQQPTQSQPRLFLPTPPPSSQQQQPPLAQVQSKLLKPNEIPRQPQKQPRPAQATSKFPNHLKDQTNAKSKHAKEKSITHYIDGLMIIETFKPPVEDKPKTIKKRKTDNHPVKGKDEDIKPVISHNNNFQIQLQPRLNVATPIPTPSRVQSSQHSNRIDSSQVGNPLITPAPIIKQQLTGPRLFSEPKKKTLSQPIRSLPTTKPVEQSTNGDNQSASLNELLSLRVKMNHWSVSDVVKFIEGHEDIKQYSSKFFEDEVDGKALLLMIDRNLNSRFQILTSMFKNGPAMKIEAILAKYKIND